MMVVDDDDDDKDGKATAPRAPKQKAQASPCHESNQKKMTLYMNEGL